MYIHVFTKYKKHGGGWSGDLKNIGRGWEGVWLFKKDMPAAGR